MRNHSQAIIERQSPFRVNLKIGTTKLAMKLITLKPFNHSTTPKLDPTAPPQKTYRFKTRTNRTNRTKSNKVNKTKQLAIYFIENLAILHRFMGSDIQAPGNYLFNMISTHALTLI